MRGRHWLPAWSLFRAHGFSARMRSPRPLSAGWRGSHAAQPCPPMPKARPNPVPNTAEAIADARAHWADHCATCHANDGSGETRKSASACIRQLRTCGVPIRSS